MHCEQHRCNRNACMDSLQSFYKNIVDDLSLDIAFCLCRYVCSEFPAVSGSCRDIDLNAELPPGSVRNNVVYELGRGRIVASVRCPHELK